MCGICGFIQSAGNPADLEVLRRMNATLVHRGPDEEGLWTKNHVALAIRRLKIIDLTTGVQPIFNEDNTIAVVFNGEIYNFQSLRRELEEKGHRFRSRADTEVLVHGYEEWGDAVVKRLNGMFAFSLWDAPRQRLLLARDRLGKKPLYYYLSPTGLLLWGSELKAILAHPDAPAPQPDLAAIHHYLSLQYVPDPWTAFQGIRKLPPASLARFQNGKLHIESYWELHYAPKHTGSETELGEELLERTRRAVAQRLISDVPLGVFLSGGIDSSVVTALMAQASTTPVKTFAIGFEEEAFNELPYARDVARLHGTDHNEFVVRYDTAEIVPRLVEYFDEPFADSSALPTYYLSKMTRQHVTVALNGDGGDETHAGYQRYRLDHLFRAYERIPPALRKPLERLLEKLPEPTGVPIERNWIAGLKRLRQVSECSPRASILRWGSYFSTRMKTECYGPRMIAAASEYPTERLLDEFFDKPRAETFLDRTLAVDVGWYLAGDLLVKADRMTMANSLEGRSPFLDYELVEWVARLPDSMKLRGSTHKYLLKKTFAPLLPPDILRRGKQGFGIPVGKWFRGQLRDMARDLLLSERFLKRELFRREALERIFNEHDSGRADHGKRIWCLIMLELWWRRYLNE